jgi:uncharacterized membrane protein YeaQ/YmgE (transglycosylase-associated protein family)
MGTFADIVFHLNPGGIIAWLVVGLLAGWLAGFVMKGSGYGIIGDLVVGLIGAVIGGVLVGVLRYRRRRVLGQHPGRLPWSLDTHCRLEVRGPQTYLVLIRNRWRSTGHAAAPTGSWRPAGWGLTGGLARGIAWSA